MIKRLLLFMSVLACVGYATRVHGQCTDPLSVTIGGSSTGSPLTFSSATVTSPIPCFGGTATVTLVVTGGNPPYDYTFDGVTNNTGVFTGILAGTYAYSITDDENCGPITGNLNVPEPEEVTKSASAQQAIICSGANAVIDVTTTMVTPNKAFNWSAAYGAVTGGAGSATSVAFGVGAISETLTNGTNADIVVTYTITPYSFGLNGIDNNGTGDDCLGMPMDVTVTVEPTPTKSASAQQAVICSGSSAVIDVTTTLTTPKTRFKWSASYGAVTGGAGSAASVAFAAGAISEVLTNGTNANIVVTYTITPYTFGPNGVDNGGTLDDCLGMPMDVMVTVEPTPTKTAAAQQLVICSGSNAVIDVTTTLTTANKAFKWSASYGAVSGGTSPQSSVAFGVGAISETLTNGTNANIVVTYTITPYTFGPNGIDDDGDPLSDDCLGTPMDVTVTVEPTPTKTATAQQLVICSGSNAVIDVTTTLTTANKAFKWSASYGAVSGGTSPQSSVAFGVGAISETLTNGTNANIVVTYTITPYTFGPNGIDDDGDPLSDDCLGTPMDVTVTVEPTPTKTATAQQLVICSGSNAVIDVSTTLTTPNTRFKWSGSYGAVTGGNPNPMNGSVAFGIAAINDGPLVNATNASIVVTYTITPYTYGLNGADDGGTGDDCLGMPMNVSVTVEPTPAATPSASMETICGGNPTITVNVTAINGNNYLVQSILNPGGVTGVTTAPYTRADGATVDAGLLTNATNATQTVTYTIRPYTYGPNGVDDSGTGDDCLGAPFTVEIKVEPATPAATPSASMETICGGTSATITVDVTAVNGNNYLVQSILNPGGVGGVTPAPYTRADGATVDAGVLTNATNATQTVTYTIVPYNYGPNGLDDSGLGDDCLGASFTVEVKVEPTPTKTATAQLALICSGTNAVIDVATTLTTPTRFKWSAAYGAVTGGTGSATSVMFGVGAINDGPLVNATAASIVVVYTITPYTYGPNGSDDGGTGDDCMGMPMDVNVTVNPVIIAGTCTTHDVCQVSKGQVLVEASGGTGVLNVTWTSVPPNASGSPAGNVNQPVPNTPGGSGTVLYMDLTHGTTYNFVVTDANGCTKQ